MVGSDYPATHSTSAIFQGEDQEQPTTTGYFSDSNSLSTTSAAASAARRRRSTPTGDTCADASGNAESCSAAGRGPRGRRAGSRLPGHRLHAGAGRGQRLGPAVGVQPGAWPRCSTRSSGSGCSAATRPRSRRAAPTPAASTATAAATPCCPPARRRAPRPTADLGTKNGDAAVVEKMSEEGAVLLKNDSRRPADHPLSDLQRRGPGDRPWRRVHDRRPDRRGLGRLRRPRRDQPAGAAQGSSAATRARSPTCRPTRRRASRCRPRRCPTRPPRSPGTWTAPPARARRPTDSSLDFTTVSGNGQLAPGNYTWTGVRVRARPPTPTRSGSSSAAACPTPT